MAMVTFGWPLAFLLLPLPIVLHWITPKRSVAKAIAVPPMLAEALNATGATSNAPRFWPLFLLWIAWALLVGAIAQPSLIAGTTVQPSTGRAMVLVMDLSSSMERKDFELDGSTVNRLMALKATARRFIDARKGDRLGLVLFGDEAYSAAPISYDLTSIAHALEESAIGMAGRATAIGDAVGLAIVKLRIDPAPTKAIILMSDGTNNSGEAEPEDAARLAASMGIRIQTIGMASERRPGVSDPIDPAADLDEATLKRVAEIGGGQFFRARTTEELAQVYGEIDRLERSASDAPPTVPRVDFRNWLLLALTIALGAATLIRRRATA